MLVLKKMSGVKRAALVAAIVLLISVIGYLIYFSFFSGKIGVTKTPTLDVDILVVPHLDPALADDFLKKTPYLDLIQTGRLPVTVSQTGRKNPFLAIPFFPAEP